MIEIYLLEQLAAFSRCGTLSAASEELHISQPAMTRSMKKIEEELGVTLFERQKNRILLNDNGRLAADLALQILERNQNMINQVRSYDRSKRTIALGCCAPVPSYELAPRLQQLYSEMTISSDIHNDDILLQGLDHDIYQLIVTHTKPVQSSYFYRICGHENLSVSVPPAHPLAAFDEISFRDLEDVPMLQYTQVGFWYELVKEKIPNPHLLLQENRTTFTEIAQFSALPTFFSDYFSQNGNGKSPSRKIIPINDAEAKVTYYLVCKIADKKRFKLLFDHLPDWCLR